MSAISDRIASRMREMGLKQAYLVERYELSKGTVSKWISGTNVPNGKNLTKLAEALETTENWIITGEPTSQENKISFIPPKETELLELTSRTIPVISWVQAGNWTPVVATDMNNVIEHLPYDPRAGKDGFALIVKGASMEPEFRKNDRIYVNPNYQIDDLPSGTLVVMSCNCDEEATFKELIVEDGKRYLRALNPNWVEPIMQLDDTCRLVGKVVGKYVMY